MDSPDGLTAAAQALLAAGDTMSAAQAFKRLGLGFSTDKNAVLAAAQGLRACRDFPGMVAVVEAALAHAPESPALLTSLAAAYAGAGRQREAAAALGRLAAVIEARLPASPRDPAVWAALGNVRTQLGLWSGAAAAFRQAAAVMPGDADTLVALARAERALGQISAAAGILDRALALDPGHPGARALRAEIGDRPQPDIGTLVAEGIAAEKEKLFGPAREKYNAVLRKAPENVIALSRLLTIDGGEGRLEDAETHHRLLTQALAKADLDAIGWLHLAALAYQTVMRPQPRTLYQGLAAALDRQLTKLAGPPLRTSPRAAAGRRLKIGYLSTWLRDHPIGQVTAGLFAAHDRARFEVHVFTRAGGPDDRYSEAIARGAEHFVRLPLAEDESARVIAACDLDILIYLDGYMDRTLLSVAARPAPIQIYWLGHAGGCDISAIDYMFADSTVVRPGEESLYAAKVIRLPECYHCASPHAVAPPPTRAEAGLPEDAFVFCGFNNTEKIDRAVFESWMRILGRVDNSVLWLSQAASPLAAENLRAAAAALGIDGARVIFAARLPDKARHLGRHMLCDLFLDTFSLTASTGALDALWAGLPLLTLEGPRFASRIAASFLKTLGLADMIAATREAYEDQAVRLAGDAGALEEIRGRLADARYSSPLFQIDGFCRALEAKLEQVFRQAERGGGGESGPL